MDASRRSLHVYGKTQAGVGALVAARGTMSTSVRQLLILIDGKRSIGDLAKIFPEDTLALSLAQLETLGYIECLEHFPDAAEEETFKLAPVETPPAPEPKAEAPRRAERRGERRRVPRESPLDVALPTAAPKAPARIEPKPMAIAEPKPEPKAEAKPEAKPAPPEADKPVPYIYAESGALAGAAKTRLNVPTESPKPARGPDTRAGTPTRSGGPATFAPDSRRDRDTISPATRQGATTTGGYRNRQAEETDASASRRPRASSRRRGSGAVAMIGVGIAAAVGGYFGQAWRPESAAPAAPAAAPAAPPAEAPPAPPAARATNPPSAPKPGKSAEAKSGREAPPAPAPAESAAASAPRPAPAVHVDDAGRGPTMHIRNQVMPQLPQLAKALGIERGHVTVVLHVNPEGSVEQVELVEATPPQVYDQAMEQAFRQWTFDPLGVPGRMKIEIEVKPQPAN